MTYLPPYKIFALGDSALTIDFGNIIDDKLNDTVISVLKKLQKRPVDGITEAVPAYSSLTLYYNVIDLRNKIPEEQTVFDWMKYKLQNFLLQDTQNFQQEKRLVEIPVCYEKEFAPDIESTAFYLKLSTEEIINIHTSKTYRVYMLGFLPGFAYLGEVDEKIVIPRKLQPIPVSEGSVGIAGKQTGVYSLNSPGGWQIIGRTPQKLFDKEKAEPVLLRSGDSVQFYSITKNEFENIKSRNA